MRTLLIALLPAFVLAGGELAADPPGSPPLKVAATQAAGRPVGGASQGQRARAPMPLPLKVVKTHVVNSRGERVRLRGVNAPGLAWSNDGEGRHVIKTMEVAIREWHANIVRLPLSQDRWLGKAPYQKDGGKSYRALVQQAVELCASHGGYIILDLHETDEGELGHHLGGVHCMPDRNSVPFWKDLAHTYRNHPAVIFDLFNEPHDVTWETWRNGGPVTETAKDGAKREYEAVGMQTLLDTVRATGARNVVIIGGLQYATNLGWFLQGNRLNDPGGHGMLYAHHWYGTKGESMGKRIQFLEKATKSLPVIFSEFGAGYRNSDPRSTPQQRERDERWNRQVLQALEDNQWNWVAWSLHPGAFPCLITDWKCTPSPWFGEWVRRALLGDLPRYAPPS